MEGDASEGFGEYSSAFQWIYWLVDLGKRDGFVD